MSTRIKSRTPPTQRATGLAAQRQANGAIKSETVRVSRWNDPDPLVVLARFHDVAHQAEIALGLHGFH